MSKKIRLSLVIIAFLLVYIFYARISINSGKTDVPVIREEVSALEIRKNGEVLRVELAGNKWVVSDKKFPAARVSVSELVKKVAELKVIDLVSERGYYHIYDLEDEKATVVCLKKGERIIRTLFIGKNSTIGRHSYVRFDNDRAVYLARDLSKIDFDLEIDDLRDKQIFSVPGDSIRELVIRSGKRQYSFYTAEASKDAEKAQVSDKQNVVKGKRWICKENEVISLDQTRMQDLVKIFEPFEAVSFPLADSKDTGKVSLKIILRTSEKEITVDIGKKYDNRGYLAVSSETPYVFLLSDWDVKRLKMDSLKDLCVHKK